jgi:hypothetical protein
VIRTRALTLLYAALLLTVNSSANPDSLSTPAAKAQVTGTWQGRVETLVEDNFQSGTSRKRLFLRTSGESLELDAPENDALRQGQQVEVTGRVSDKRLTVSQVIASQSVSHDESASGSCTATGQQTVAVILASYPSKALLSSVTPKLMSDSFFGTGQTLDNFVRESSFGQSWVTGDVLGPFVLDADYFDQPLGALDAALRAAAPTADLTKYNRIFVVAPQGETGMDSGGMALLGCGPIPSPQGTLNASSIWLGAESMVGQAEIVGTASHELGHGFGLEHARFADYGSDPLGPAGQAPAPWDSLHEYGDSFSSMGRQFAQWAAPHKALLGWLQTGTNIQTVTAGGTITLSPYEQTGNGQVVRLSRGVGGNAWLWLEYRQPLGTFDATLPAAAFAGALVHYEDPALTATLSGVDPATYTNLVNFHPAGSSNDPVLHAGETWTDAYGSLSLTVNWATTAGLNISVSYAPAPVCPSSLGAASSPYATQAFDAAGGTGVIPVTAAAACAWNSAASVSWISLSPTGAGTGNGSLSFSVAPNINVSSRWGRIAVGGAFVIVTQTGAAGSITISPQTALIPAAGGMGEISVAASAPDVAWDTGSSVPWITDVECSCFVTGGSATLRYIVAANTGPQQRTGFISVGSLSFKVTQEGWGRDPDNLTWNLLAPQDAPDARLNMAMAPTGLSGQAILYGGAWDTTVFADTWLWNGSNWGLLQPANSPGLLSGHAMAYDAARGQVVLFGGTIGATSTYSNQTWVWDGNNWKQMQPAVSPPARFGHAMAYDAVSQKVVLFGGYGDYAETNDTWTWDGTNWTQVLSPAGPLARSGHAMAFDAARGEIVLFGGFVSQPSPTWFSDTWVWDAVNGWQQKFSATPPAARAGHILAFHPAMASVVMIGGMGGKDIAADGTWYYDYREETWTWNGEAWTQQFPANQPGAAYTMGAAWDQSRQALIIHLGDDLTCLTRGPMTFLLQGSAPSVATFGPPRR